MKNIYLDYAAASPLHPDVLSVMQPYLQAYFYNPSATYLAAQKIAKDIQTYRQKVAEIIGCRPTEIVFTAGGSEANNLAITGIMQQYPDKHLVVSSVEHDSVLEPAKQFDFTHVPVKEDGRISVDQLVRCITDQTVLVSIMYANNEIGTVMSLSRIAKAIEQIRQKRKSSGNTLPLMLHTDACQAALYLNIQVKYLGVDLMTLNGGKIYGPKQSGMLYVRTGIKLSPQVRGGGQERGLRSGTENVAGIVGFSKALSLASENQKTVAKDIKKLQDQFVSEITKAVPSAVINGSRKYRLPNNIHLTFPGTDNERLMMELDERGIMCAIGSACSASSDEPSHVLKAIGLSDAAAQSSLRFTLGSSTTEADIHFTTKTLKDLLQP